MLKMIFTLVYVKFRTTSHPSVLVVFIVDHNIDNLILEAAAGAPSLYTTITGFVC